jgi:hypothetical protein
VRCEQFVRAGRARPQERRLRWVGECSGGAPLLARLDVSVIRREVEENGLEEDAILSARIGRDFRPRKPGFRGSRPRLRVEQVGVVILWLRDRVEFDQRVGGSKPSLPVDTVILPRRERSNEDPRGVGVRSPRTRSTSALNSGRSAHRRAVRSLTPRVSAMVFQVRPCARIPAAVVSRSRSCRISSFDFSLGRRNRTLAPGSVTAQAPVSCGIDARALTSVARAFGALRCAPDDVSQGPGSRL